jgi:P-type E1-E2 ATPase
VATAVGSALGIDDIRADATPESKAQAVGALRQAGETVVMVGDGLNDAPALAAADVGIALGATGSTISSDAADAVVLVDDLGRIAEALEIGRDTLAIARTGIVLGMGLSAVLMIIAAFGGITPLQGAIAQEAVDVAAILNALRALHGPGKASRPRSRITRARRAAKLA